MADVTTTEQCFRYEDGQTLISIYKFSGDCVELLDAIRTGMIREYEAQYNYHKPTSEQTDAHITTSLDDLVWLIDFPRVNQMNYHVI